jgi:hypothetical protein
LASGRDFSETGTSHQATQPEVGGQDVEYEKTEVITGIRVLLGRYAQLVRGQPPMYHQVCPVSEWRRDVYLSTATAVAAWWSVAAGIELDFIGGIRAADQFFS